MLSEDEPFACNAYHNIFREPNLSRDTQLQQKNTILLTVIKISFLLLSSVVAELGQNSSLNKKEPNKPQPKNRNM